MEESCRPLGAQHAAIDGVIAVALKEADAAVAEENLDPAAAGAHVAGSPAHIVSDFGRRVDGGFWHGWALAGVAGAEAHYAAGGQSKGCRAVWQ